MSIQQIFSITGIRTIVVTGSFGKTNCMELIRQILIRAGFRTACIRHLSELSEKPPAEKWDFAVIRVPFPELKKLLFVPDTVIVTNISAYPLVHYRLYRDLLEDIRSFLMTLRNDTVLIMNSEYQFVRSAMKEAYDIPIHYPFRTNGVLEEGVWVSDDQLIVMTVGDQIVPVVKASDLLLWGERNRPIYLPAIAAVSSYADISVIAEVCLSYQGCLPHFYCHEIERGIRLFMQLSTGRPSLAEAAFVGFPEKPVIVTGTIKDTFPNQTWQGYGLMLSAYAKRLILFGEDRELIAYAVRKVGVTRSYDLKIEFRKTAEEALSYAVKSSPDREKILFVPVDSMKSTDFNPEKLHFETIPAANMKGKYKK